MILVTGAAGYVGSALAAHLLESGRRVRLVDNFSTGTVRSVHGEPVHELDLSEAALLPDALAGVTAVVHLAAVSGIADCEQKPAAATAANLVATRLLAQAAAAAGVRRLVFASTIAVYGNATGRVTEKARPAPVSLYGFLKKWGEEALLYTAASTGLSVMILRKTNIYGYGLCAKHVVVHNFIETARQRRPLTVTGSGAQVRNFIHLQDAVRIYARAVDSSHTGICHVAGPDQLTIRTLAERVSKTAQRLHGYEVPIVYTGEGGGTAGDARYDDTRLHRLLHYRPQRRLGAFLVEALAGH